jgi:hypothetical protein
MFGLHDQNTTLADTSLVKIADDCDDGRTHTERARKREVEDRPISQARETVNE